MKVYLVVYEYGEYSDRGWSFMGVYSAKEKAQAFIDKKCEKIDPETKREEWLAHIEKLKLLRLENIEKTKKEIEAKLLEKKHIYQQFPDWGKGKLKRLQGSLEALERLEPYQSLEDFVRWTYRQYDARDFDILEREVDQENES
jgi:hypothetical protein